MTLNAEIGGFVDFLAISGCDTSLYHSQGGAKELSLCAQQHDCNKGVVFYPKFLHNSNSDRNFRCTISLCCERNNLLFSTFLMHSRLIW